MRKHTAGATLASETLLGDPLRRLAHSGRFQVSGDQVSGDHVQRGQRERSEPWFPVRLLRQGPRWVLVLRYVHLLWFGSFSEPCPKSSKCLLHTPIP